MIVWTQIKGEEKLASEEGSREKKKKKVDEILVRGKAPKVPLPWIPTETEKEEVRERREKGKRRAKERREEKKRYPLEKGEVLTGGGEENTLAEGEERGGPETRARSTPVAGKEKPGTGELCEQGHHLTKRKVNEGVRKVNRPNKKK